MCRRKGLTLKANKSKVICLDEEEGLECEVLEDGITSGYYCSNIWSMFSMNQVQILLSLTRRYSCGLSQLYEDLVGANLSVATTAA